MEITDIRITLVDDKKLRAFASITLDNCFAVRGLKIIQGVKSTFVAMPSRKRPDGTREDIAHPINPETRERFETAILKAYAEADSERTKSEELQGDEASLSAHAAAIPQGETLPKKK